MTKREAAHLSDVLKAYSEGKSIEYQFHGSWMPVLVTTNLESIIGFHSVRIKPEPKYRPYKNTEEFLNASKKHGPYLCIAEQCYFPDTIFSNGISFAKTSEYFETFDQVFKKYKWQDGTPCGIMEE